MFAIENKFTKLRHLKWLAVATALSPGLLYLWCTKKIFGDGDFDYLWEEVVKPGYKTHWRLLLDSEVPWL